MVLSLYLWFKCLSYLQITMISKRQAYLRWMARLSERLLIVDMLQEQAAIMSFCTSSDDFRLFFTHNLMKIVMNYLAHSYHRLHSQHAFRYPLHCPPYVFLTWRVVWQLQQSAQILQDITRRHLRLPLQSRLPQCRHVLQVLLYRSEGNFGADPILQHHTFFVEGQSREDSFQMCEDHFSLLRSYQAVSLPDYAYQYNHIGRTIELTLHKALVQLLRAFRHEGSILMQRLLQQLDSLQQHADAVEAQRRVLLVN